MDTLDYPLSSEQVAVLLGVKRPVLSHIVCRDRISPRPRYVAGRLVWYADDIERARVAVACRRGRGRPRKQVKS
jgi:hypothetical protein